MADDESVNRMLLVRRLRRLLPGLAVLEARDGQALLELYDAQAPSGRVLAVLTDYEMPRKTGGEAVAALRAPPRSCAVPCIGITGNALADDVQRFRAAGADAVFTKPVDMEALVAALRPSLPPSAFVPR